MIYLLKTQTRSGAYFKVGYTLNLAKRLLPYFTHNPAIEILEVVKTYKKTKLSLEKEIHKEITNLGYSFKVAKNGTLTEWFFVPADKEDEFQKQGLKQFKACQSRKVYKVD